MAGAGFPNVVVDPDGVRRRIELLARYNDSYFPQLAFSAVYDILGQPEMVTRENSIELKGAMLPDAEEPQDIRIPLAEEGRFLINWPQGEYEETFRRMSFWQLELMQRLEERLMTNLRNLRGLGTFNGYSFTNDPIQQYEQAEQLKEQMLAGGDPSQMEQYRQMRQSLFDEVGAFLESDTEEWFTSQIQSALDSGQLGEDQVERYQSALDATAQNFSASRDLYSELETARSRIAEQVEDALIFVGYTGTGTTDIGVNPFDEDYKNVGTHASVANTIFQGRYLDQLPLWYSIIAAFVLALATAFIIRNLDPLPSLLVGFFITLAVFAAGSAFFIFTRSYFPLLTPLLATFFTFLTIVGIKFVQTAQERSFIRNAFSHYLSSDVINQIIDDPSKLNLGGEKKYLTAFFTDVKGFSTISEALDPSDLVKLLNNYLTEMSNIILDLQGTIDKFEGDAIISFFGAPIEYEDHAARACRAAVRMKKMERIINDHVLEENLSPTPLYTRIGINTGEMVVGNMGTAQKMDYTMMGNSVNLAARLEGVNKQYGTWTLVSEATRTDAGEDFAFRELDRVRVVGISEPVRLFELVDEKSMMDSETAELLDSFRDGLESFENREWQEALKKFQETLKIRPEDGPTQFFVKRCKEFIRKPPPENWDGAFNLTMK
jgi:adenylate cyclase